MKQWHIIQLKPNCLGLAVKNLQRQGFETFMPMQEISCRKSSRFVTKLNPLFPGYMFVGIEEKAIPWRKINSTKGVSRLVRFNDAPKPLPFQLVSNLMLRCDGNGKLMPPKTPSPGDRVEVLSGPFTNFVATVEKIDVNQRFWILTELMGHLTRLHIAPDQVQLAI